MPVPETPNSEVVHEPHRREREEHGDKIQCPDLFANVRTDTLILYSNFHIQGLVHVWRNCNRSLNMFRIEGMLDSRMLDTRRLSDFRCRSLFGIQPGSPRIVQRELSPKPMDIIKRIKYNADGILVSENSENRLEGYGRTLQRQHQSYTSWSASSERHLCRRPRVPVTDIRVLRTLTTIS